MSSSRLVRSAVVCTICDRTEELVLSRRQTSPVGVATNTGRLDYGRRRFHVTRSSQLFTSRAPNATTCSRWSVNRSCTLAEFRRLRVPSGWRARDRGSLSTWSSEIKSAYVSAS